MESFDDQLVFDLDAVEADLKTHGESTVQFNRPLGEELRIVLPDDETPGRLISRPAYSARLRDMCKRWGARLTVRFYAHHGHVFDGRAVLEFPEIQSLMINGMYDEVQNLEAIGELSRLTHLHLGVFEIKDKRLLASLPLGKLSALTLEETRTKALDLAPLAKARALRVLRLFGHKKNIEVVGELSGLQAFAFNPSKNRVPDFLNGLPALISLKFVLGGGETVAGLADLPKLEEIAFTKVLGLANIGDLQRFPALKRALVQDQAQLEQVRMGAKNKVLQHLWFYNCPKLAKLDGLDRLPALASLRVVISALKLGGMTLPKSLTHLCLYSAQATKENDERRAIEALGLVPEDHPDMPFFYK